MCFIPRRSGEVLYQMVVFERGRPQDTVLKVAVDHAHAPALS